MEFKVLGSVEVVDDSGRRSLGGPQQRKLLAVMLCDPGRTLTYDRLLEVLWPIDEQPDNARRTAISYVSRLRAALGEGWVTTTDAGYSLDVSRASVDALRFSALVESAGDLAPTHAVDVLDEALALWRGPVFGDLHSEWWALPFVSRLDELRLAALAQRLDALAAGGWDDRALAEAQALVAMHPLRGAFVDRLMRGLQARGRTDEALRAFQAHRDELIEQTGLEPSSDLAALDSSIASSGHQAVSNEPLGRALRGYILRDVLGEGSFGTVYRATQPQVARDVAIKVVRAEMADDRRFIHRFEAEAQMVARLEHPHIVPLYDFWREPGGAYLVFRFLRGGTAEHALLAGGPFALDRATRVLEQIGGALTSAHAAGVVHRDVKPANILLDEDGEAYLSDFGIATGNTDDLDDARTNGAAKYGWSAGSPLYTSPEQARDGAADGRADQYSLALTMWELLTGRPPFHGSNAAEVLAAKLQAPLAALCSVRPFLPSHLDDVLRRASAVHPDDRFETIAEFVVSWQEAVALGTITDTAPPDRPTGAAAMPSESDRVVATAPLIAGLVANPFKGLRAFGEVDANEFFGRAALVEQLWEMIGLHGFTAVVGPSGSGKSSLVLAGLVPLLRRDGSLVITFTSGDNPFGAMAAAFAEIATTQHSAAVTPESLRRAGGLVAAVDAVAHDDDLVIVIDQLEELWTTADPEDRSAFAAALADLERSPARARMIATVRADWFDRPLRDPSLGPLVARATFGVTAMQATELHEAIIEPAAKVGVRFEAGLVGRIVSEALDQPGSLPLLQFALTELFDRRSGATVTTVSYDEIGGLSGSIAHQAEALYAGLAADEQRAVRRLFARLVTAGDGGEDTRRRARYSELVAVPDSVVAALVDRRLLTVDRDRDSREPTVEIAHEALLRSWPRLRDWLEEDRDWLRELRGLASAARLWQAGGRDDADLYRGARLAVISELVPDRADALTPPEADFVKASVQLADAERVQDQERARVRERQNRRLRRSLVGLGVVVVLALIAGSLAVVQSRRADDEASRAGEQAALAAERSNDADAQRAVADEQRLVAEEQRLAADEQRTAAEASAEEATAAERSSAIQNLVNTSVLQRGNRQDLAALLAIEAYRIDPVAAKSALFSTFTRNLGFVGYQYLDAEAGVFAVAPLPDGETAIAAVDGVRLVTVDLATATIIDTFDDLGPYVTDRFDYATLLRLSGDGRIAVLATQGSTSMVWRAYDVASGGPLGDVVEVPFDAPDVPTPDPNLFRGFGDASVNSDGSQFAISGGPIGHAMVFDTSTGARVGELEVAPPPVEIGGWAGWTTPHRTASVAFAPDGDLFVGGPTGEILVTDPTAVVDGELMPTARLQGAQWGVEYGIRFGASPDGPFLITFGSAFVSRLELADGSRRWTVRARSEASGFGLPFPIDGYYPCRDVVVAWARDHFYCADDAGSVIEYNVADGTATTRVFDRQTGVTGALAVTPDSTRLIAGSYTSSALATWRLDGAGPIQRVIAADTGSLLTFGYNSSGTSIGSAASGQFLERSVFDSTTGELKLDLGQQDLFADLWAADPNEVWLSSYDFSTGLLTMQRFDIASSLPIPGTSISAPGFPILIDDDAHQRLYLTWPHEVQVLDHQGNYIGPTITPPVRSGQRFRSVSATPDGTKLVISLWFETHLYDAVTGVRLATSPLPLLVSVVSPSGIAAGSTIDGRIYLFDPDTLEPIAELQGSHGFVHNLAISADGSTLVARNDTDGIRIYDVATRTQLGDPIPVVDGAIRSFSLRPDAKELAVPSADLGVVLWDLDPAHWLDAACAVAGRNLTQEEWDQYLGHFDEYHESCVDGKANP